MKIFVDGPDADRHMIVISAGQLLATDPESAAPLQPHLR